MERKVFVKDPDALLDFSIDWSDFLGSDEIVSSNWLVPEGIQKVADFQSEALTTVWLAGGTNGRVYPVTNRITTLDGRINDWTILILVRDT